MSLEDLEAELYGLKGRKKSVAAKTKKTAEEKEVPSTWEEPRSATTQRENIEPEPRPRWRRAVLLGLAGLFVLIVGAGALFISRLTTSGRTVDLSVSTPKEIYRGMPFELTVVVTNNLDNLITDSNLTLKLPAGVVNLGGLGSDQTLIQEPVGDVGSGSFEKRTFNLLPVGDSQSVQKIEIGFSYISGGRTRFETKNTTEVTIGASAITVSVKKPDHVLRDSPFSFVLTYANATNYDFPNVTLSFNYPTAFKFVSSAELPPDSLNNHWSIGELKSGSSGTLTVKGTYQGTDNASLVIPYTLSVNFLGNDYPIVSDAISLALAPSPVNLQVLANGRTDYIARIGDNITYTIQYQNMSGIALTDVVVTMNLVGDLIDMSTVKTQANIDSKTNTLTWNASNTPQFRLLDPGASGELSVNVNLKSAFPIRRLGDKNYTVMSSIVLDSPSVPYYLEASKTTATAVLETKVAGQAAFDVKAFYRDAAATIVNDGPFPPKVRQPTEYTIHWVITNYSTDIKNVAVKASLQSGIEWTNVVKSNVDSVPLYNDRTGEITWSVDKIPATKGVLSSPVEAVFQVRATPNATQVGQYEPLLGASTFSAIDDFTGLNIESSAGALSTALPDDPTVGQGGGIVVQ